MHCNAPDCQRTSAGCPRCDMPPMTRAQAAAWIAFLADLLGRSGRFFAFDPDMAISSQKRAK